MAMATRLEAGIVVGGGVGVVGVGVGVGVVVVVVGVVGVMGLTENEKCTAPNLEYQVSMIAKFALCTATA
jgi:hypothetical protein